VDDRVSHAIASLNGTDIFFMTNQSGLLRSSRAILGAVLALAFSSGCAHAQSCKLGEQTVVPLTLAGAAGYPLIPVTVDGQSAHVLLETDSRVTLLNRAPLEKLGIPIRKVETTYTVDMMAVQLSRFSAAGIDTKGYFSVIDSDSDILGSLGMNYFNRRDMELWLANKEMRLSRPSGCRKAFLASWDPQAHVVDVEIDQSLRDWRPWFKVRINGTDVNAIIATSSPYSYLDLHTAARLGIKPDSPGVAQSGEVISWRDKTMKVWRAPVTEMSIGKYKVPNPRLYLFDMTLSGEMMVLGLDFLRNHRVLISMSQRRLYISHLGGPTFSEPK